MADTREQPVPLQTDTITQLPGAGVRTIIAQVLVNGVPTPVQMQVVAISDANGIIIDNFAQVSLLQAIVSELQQLRTIIATAYGFPTFSLATFNASNQPDDAA